LQEEKARLAQIKEKMSDEELEEVIKKTQVLKELQAAEDSPEDRATIPALELGDLKREVTEYPIAVSENESNSGVTVLRHELGSTSGIAYVKLGVDLSQLDVEDIALLPLFTRVMMETGAGAVHPDGSNESEILDGNYLQTKLIVSGKATSDKTTEMFDLMKLILTDARLDSKSRVIEMLKESKSRRESQIVGR
jgi:Zn-dependent M16 (insulinase) family peptidase